MRKRAPGAISEAGKQNGAARADEGNDDAQRFREGAGDPVKRKAAGTPAGKRTEVKDSHDRYG